MIYCIQQFIVPQEIVTVKQRLIENLREFGHIRWIDYTKSPVRTQRCRDAVGGAWGYILFGKISMRRLPMTVIIKLFHKRLRHHVGIRADNQFAGCDIHLQNIPYMQISGTEIENFGEILICVIHVMVGFQVITCYVFFRNCRIRIDGNQHTRLICTLLEIMVYSV